MRVLNNVHAQDFGIDPNQALGNQAVLDDPWIDVTCRARKYEAKHSGLGGEMATALSKRIASTCEVPTGARQLGCSGRRVTDNGAEVNFAGPLFEKAGRRAGCAAQPSELENSRLPVGVTHRQQRRLCVIRAQEFGIGSEVADQVRPWSEVSLVRGRAVRSRKAPRAQPTDNG